MAKTKGNTCALCGVAIKADQDLCKICEQTAKASRAKAPRMPCRACGAANPPGVSACSNCGAPLRTAPSRENSRSRGDDSALSTEVLLGRQAELQVLEDCFDVCINSGRVGGAIVSAEPGMGVSAVLDAFAKRLSGRLPQDRIFSVSCRGMHDAFAPMRAALKQILLINGEKNPDVCRKKLSERVGRVLGGGQTALVTETVHILGYLAGVQFPDSHVMKSLETDHDLMQRRFKEATVRYLEAEASQSPIVLIFDEVHEISPSAKTFMVDVIESMKPVPLTIVVGGQPDIKNITKNSAVVRIDLEPLDDNVMRRIFKLFLSKLTDPPDEVVEAVVGRAAGNPGSLRELCSLLIETGVVNTDGDPWTADVERLARADMPVDPLDALIALLNRLDPRDRQVLHHAAVVGDVFWDETVLALSRQRLRPKGGVGAAQVWADDSDRLAISSSLDRLVERRFVVKLPESDIKGCIKYAFARPGIREHVLADTNAEKMKQDHILIAQWISYASIESGQFFMEEEAHHWEKAGERNRAALACFKAARHARERYLNHKAIALFKKGITLSDERNRLNAIDAFHDLGSVQELLGQYEDAEKCFTKMLHNAWMLAYYGKAGAALNRIGRLYRVRGDASAARAFINRGMALFKATGDEKGIAACLGDLGELARRQGSYDRAFKLVSEALELQRKIENKRSIALCLHTLGHIETARASYGQAERYLEESLKIRREIDDKGGTAQTLSALAIVLFNKGELDKAIVRWEAALGLAQEVGDRRMQAIVHNNLGETLRDQGKLDLSMEHLKACQEVVETLDDGLLNAEALRNIGILDQKMGNLNEAKEHLERSLALAKQFGGKEMEGLALRALGEIGFASAGGAAKKKDDNAQSHFGEAIDIFRSIGNEFEVARTLMAMGKLLNDTGDAAAGKKSLDEAREILDRIDSKADGKSIRWNGKSAK